MKITAKVTDGASDDLRSLISMLTGDQSAALNAVGGRAASNAASAYHREYEARGGWENPALPTHGPGRMDTGFGTKVADSWFMSGADREGATISNDAPHLGHKVRGGRITPKRVKFLTIPMVPEAHGRTAATYERDFGTDLFTIPGRNALFEKTTKGSESVQHRTYGKKKNGQKVQISARGHIRAVFALTRSVDQEPWSGALPSSEELVTAYSLAWRGELIKRLKE